MPRYDVTIEALGPLVLGGGSAADNLQTSLRYVMGSAWRGAVAGAVLAGQGKRRYSGRAVADPTPDPDFATLFLGAAAARFGFLYPARHAFDAPGAGTTMPAPLTAQTCKLDESHAIVDGLLDRLRVAAGGAAVRHACPVCDERLERLRGLLYHSGASGYEQVKVAPHSFVRVGLNRYTETAQDQVLYVLDALTPGPRLKSIPAGTAHRQANPRLDPDELPGPLSFLGGWWGDSAQRQALDSMLEAHLLPDEDGYRLAIGADRARGMGQVRLRVGPAATPPATLEQRLDAIQPAQNGQPLDPAHCYATLTLRAPLLLLDSYGLPARSVSAPILREYHPSAPPDLEVLPKASVIERMAAGGWSSAWGLPKPVHPALAAGSVLALQAPIAQRGQLLRYLADLEQQGLGERAAEGWGEVLACDPFHTTYDAGRPSKGVAQP
jgi:CRISPR-associated protein Csx10